MADVLSKARSLLSTIQGYAPGFGVTLPDTAYHYAQLGQPVVDRPSVIVGAVQTAGLIDFNSANQVRIAPPQQATYFATITRDYQVVTDEGFSIPELVIERSEEIQKDGDLLWAVAYGDATEGYLGPSNVSVSWTITGFIVITTLQMTIGVAFDDV